MAHISYKHTKIYVYIGVSINVGTPIAGCFFLENPMTMDDLGVPIFQETSIYVYIHNTSSTAQGGGGSFRIGNL